MTVYDMFIKFQIYHLSVSTVCKDTYNHFKDVTSGSTVRAWVILNRRDIIFETEKHLILKRN
jgi:hypothetical protein